MLFTGTYPALATVANGGQVTNANGYDIGFYGDQSLSTKLNWETVTYTAATGQVVYWVRVPTLSHTVPTHIYLAYGNTAITTDQSNKTGTWDANYKGVWHFEENAANTTVGDATGNGGGTSSANTSVLHTAAGIVGSGFLFDNTNQNIAMTNTLLTTGSAYTISWWENITSNSGAYPSRFILNQTTNRFLVFRQDGTDAAYAHLAWGPDPVASSPGAFHDASAPTVASSIGVWHHFCLTGTDPATTTPGNTSVYSDGVSHTVSQTAGAAFGTLTVNRIGHDGTDQPTNATLDEIRISTGIRRSVDWALAEYNNQSSPSTFYSIQLLNSDSNSGWNGLKNFGVGDGLSRSEWAN